jgi:hypothetical protein
MTEIGPIGVAGLVATAKRQQAGNGKGSDPVHRRLGAGKWRQYACAV